jgi:hypothetical protein
LRSRCGFQVDGKTDPAVALMKQTKVYQIDKTSSPPAMEFIDGSGKDINTVFPDNFRFFELLAMLENEEPVDVFGPLDRAQMPAIGIEKGKPFNPDEKTKGRRVAIVPSFILSGAPFFRPLQNKTGHSVLRRSGFGEFLPSRRAPGDGKTRR